MTDRGLVIVFTGDGKGKTTAALGMAFRASGHGMKTCMIQFVKSDDTVGEIAAAAAAPWIEIHQTGLGFLPPLHGPKMAAHREAAQAGLRLAREAIHSGRYQMVICDEICFAVSRQLVDEAQVVELAASAAPELLLVFTGRYASASLMALADTVSEMRLLKHGYDSGVAAQDGVER